MVSKSVYKYPIQRLHLNVLLVLNNMVFEAESDVGF